MPKLTANLIPAILTPMTPSGDVDWAQAQALTAHLADEGCDGILVNGTTGENPTLSQNEKHRWVAVAKEAIAGKTVNGKRVQLVAGVGSNDTRASVEDAKATAALGVDALLVVVPYYNKPTQAGMLAHFQAVARAVPDTEIVIYNIPSRCMVQMSAETMVQLHASCPNIVGVKQSVPDMDSVSTLRQLVGTPQSWSTYCGDDSLTLPMMSCGAVGTFSVLAHIAARPMRAMIDAYHAGDIARAQAIHLKLQWFGQEIFFLPNPTVIKSALSRLGWCTPTMRLPLVEPNVAEWARIDAMLDQWQAVSWDGLLSEKSPALV